MNEIIIIPQGEMALYHVQSNRWNFSLEDNDFMLEILFGMNGRKVVIEKKDVVDNRFSFDTTGMIGQLTARMTMIMNDPDCPDDKREEVDEQIIGFVSISPCTKLHHCPACGGQHDITYTYMNGVQ